LSTKTMCAFFNEINPLRDFVKCTSCVKYVSRVKCATARKGFISFHIATKEQYFTISARKLFHIRQRRIFHLKS